MRLQPRSSHLDLRLYRQAGRDQMLGIWLLVEDDLDGQALNDLNVVAGRILWRQQRKARAGASLEAVNMPPEDFVRISVQPDLDWLPGAHSAELCLLEVRQFPHLGGDEDEQRLAGLQERAELDRLPRDSSIFRRKDLRVGKIKLGLSHSGLGLLDLRAGGLHLRLLDSDLLRGRVGLVQFAGGLADLSLCPCDLRE